MYLLRVALWVLGVVSIALGLSLSGSAHAAVLLGVFFVLGVVLLGLAEVYADRRRKRDWYARSFASRDALRDSVDVPALRRVRDERGEAKAVRELRRRYPKLPLREAAELIRSL